MRSLTRFSDEGRIPPLSPEQWEALQVLEETCQRHKLHMILDVGDIQWLSNEHVLHSRTAYKDHAPPTPRRHLMRLWLSSRRVKVAGIYRSMIAMRRSVEGFKWTIRLRSIRWMESDPWSF